MTAMMYICLGCAIMLAHAEIVYLAKRLRDLEDRIDRERTGEQS